MGDYLLQKAALVREGYEDIWWILYKSGNLAEPIRVFPDYEMENIIKQYEQQKERRCYHEQPKKKK
jgi:hypothetical protein